MPWLAPRMVGLVSTVEPARRHTDLTLVVPTLNEAPNIQRFLDEAERHVPGARVLLADDDSQDGTRAIAASFRGDLRVAVLHRTDRADRGLTASVADALLAVETPFAVVMDADLQHPFAALPDMLTALDDGAEVAIGTRIDDASFSFRRRMASRIARGLASLHLARRAGVRPRDPMSGFFGGRADLLRDIVRERGAAFERGGYKVLMDVLLHAPRPLRIAEVEYVFGARHAGESKLALHHYLSFLRQLGTTGRLTASLLELLVTGILFRFALVGATGVGVNLFTLWALHEGAALPIWLAAPVAIEMSVLWNFAWNESWTFRGRDTGTSLGTRMGQFHVASLVGMLLQFVVLTGGVLAMPEVHYALWSILGIAVGSGANFVINLKWTWGVPVEDS